MLSTMHSHPDVDSDSSKKKPEVILYYHSTKNEVDTLDRMIRTYSCKRMTRRWPVALFYNIIDVSAVNAYVMWQQIQNDSTSTISMKKRITFLIQFGKKLAGIVSSVSTPTRRTTSRKAKEKGLQSTIREQEQKKQDVTHVREAKTENADKPVSYLLLQ